MDHQQGSVAGHHLDDLAAEPGGHGPRQLVDARVDGRVDALAQLDHHAALALRPDPHPGPYASPAVPGGPPARPRLTVAAREAWS